MNRERRLGVKTLLLTLAVAVLGGYVYVTEIRGGAAKERAEASATHLLPVKIETVTELRIEKPGSRFILRKESGNWRIVEPIQSLGDESTITRLLTDLADAKIDRTIDRRIGDLSAYGLSKPMAVTVAAGDQRTVLSLGKPNATNEFVYALRDSDSHSVYLVERRAASVGDKSLFDLREKTVLDFGADEVTAVTFINRVGHVRLVRHVGQAKGGQPGGWELVEPIRAVADRGKVERSLELLGSIRAEQFAEEEHKNLVKYGLTAPWGRAQFDLGKRSETLLLGKEAKYGALSGYYACRPGGGPVYIINGNLANEANRPAAEWRDKRLADFHREDVAELRLITPARTVVCAKKEKETEWGLAEFKGVVAEGMNLAAAAKMPSALQADSAKVDELLSRLSTLEAVRFIDSGVENTAYGLDRPALKIVARDKGGKQLASLSIGGRAATNCYATSDHIRTIVLVPATDTKRYGVRAEDLAAR